MKKYGCAVLLGVLWACSAQADVKVVIFDWAGTVVDWGSKAPMVAVQKVFEAEGVPITPEEALGPMGLEKRRHIEKLLDDPNIANRWRLSHEGAWPTAADTNKLYKALNPMLLKLIPEFSQLIPGVLETQDVLKKSQIKTGTTTGYNSLILAELVKLAALQGFTSDINVASDQVLNSRPSPEMVRHVCHILGVRTNTALKVDDSLPGIEAGNHAGSWTALVSESGALKHLSKQAIFDQINTHNAPHFMIPSVAHIPKVLALIKNYEQDNLSPEQAPRMILEGYRS